MVAILRKAIILGVFDALLLFLIVPILGTGSIDIPLPSFYTGELSPIFRPEVLAWESLILSLADEYHLEPNAVATVMQIESCGDPLAVSSAGARGLFQVMPFHFTANEDMHDPVTNGRRGMAFLSNRLHAANGDYPLAFAQYNGGATVLHQPFNDWYAETQRYYSYAKLIYADAQAGKLSSEALTNWYTQRGVSLCAQAAVNQGERLDLIFPQVRIASEVRTRTTVTFDGRALIDALVELAGQPTISWRELAPTADRGVAYTGNGRSPVIIPGCLAQPAPIDPETAVVTPYRTSTWHTRTGNGVHGCNVGWPGVDFKAGSDREQLYSPITGVVVANYTEAGTGNTILIIENEHYTVVMLHGDFIPTSGTRVVRGVTHIGNQNTHGYSTGPHMHMQVYDERVQSWIDPFYFFYPG